MTDTQTMIREVCEALGRSTVVRGMGDTAGTRHIRPHTDYNDAHMLIGWLGEKAFEVDTYIRWGRKSRCLVWAHNGYHVGYASNEDWRLAVLHAAHKALTDE